MCDQLFNKARWYVSRAFSNPAILPELCQSPSDIAGNLIPQRTGKEAVLMYISDLYASIGPYTKRLRAFSKIDLKSGETKNVIFKIDVKDIAFINDISKSVTEPGEFKIRIADQTINFNYRITKKFKPAVEGKL